MTTGKQLLTAIAERRARTVEKITAEPEKFCVCEGCSSILTVAALQKKPQWICNFCHAYRFDYTRAGVLAMVGSMTDRPFATTAPFIPRFAAQLNEA